ncbi:sensor histidine kinase [Sphingomonas sp. NPDC079357]|uniref:sensor histidine kinase n=1 Tax=Sphingomonas sp. NPDC079357 TaxID=3364518 RepID=UPI0038501B16
MSKHWPELIADCEEQDRADAYLAEIYNATAGARSRLYLLLNDDMRIENVGGGDAGQGHERWSLLPGQRFEDLLADGFEPLRRDLTRRGAPPLSRYTHDLLLKGTEGRTTRVKAFFYPLIVEGRHYWFVEAATLLPEQAGDRVATDFIVNISHELHTPLSAIAGALGLIAGGATGSVGEDAAQMVRVALSSTKRLMRLINDLLDSERLSRGKLHFVMERQSLREMVQSALQELTPLAVARNIRLTIEDDGRRDIVRVDRDRFSQVAINIISNAIKFSPDGAEIRLVLKNDANFRRFAVIDNGVGVPEPFRKRIFERFVQVDMPSRRKRNGVGLGLSISRDIVERLSGRLWFAPNPDGGAIFTVEIPAAA